MLSLLKAVIYSKISILLWHIIIKETEAHTMKNKDSLLQAVKFILFSTSAGIIQTVTFALMNETLTLPYWPSYLTALILSILWNFTFNRKFTFKSAVNVPIAMAKVAGFYAVFTPVSTILGNYFAENMAVNEYIVLAITMLCNLFTEFLYDKYFVFTDVRSKSNE